MGLLSPEGAAVIFVSPQPRGLQAQTELVVGHYANWQELLGAEVPGYSAWLQRTHGRLRRASFDGTLPPQTADSPAHQRPTA